MRLPIVGLILLSFALSWLLTFTMKRIAPRLGFVDKPGGRKIHANPKPLGGGVAIFWAFALPLLVAIAQAHILPLGTWHTPMANEQGRLDKALAGGIRLHTPMAMTLFGAALVLHILG